MGLRADLLAVVLQDLPNPDSVINRSDPLFDELQGGKLGPGRWARFEDPGDHRYGTTCATTLVGWLLATGTAPPAMLNAAPPGGSGFTPGAHFSRMNTYAQSVGWWNTPVSGQLPNLRPGDIYELDHGAGGNAHTGVILSVTPSADGQSLVVETADGGQNSAGLADIHRQIRTFSLGDSTHPVLYSATATSGWLTGWISVGGAEELPADTSGQGGQPSQPDSGTGGAPPQAGSSSVIPALLITAGAFAAIYAVASAVTSKTGGTMASSDGGMVLTRGELHTPHGVIRMKRIGAGTFAAVYRETCGEKRVFIFLPHGVPDKEIAEIAHRAHPDNPHIPAVEYFGATEDKAIYTMPFYKTPYRKANAGDSWDDYSILKECLYNSNSKYRHDRKVNDETVKCAKRVGVEPGVVKALAALDKATKKFSPKYAFEFSPRNIGVDDDGNMVLLDVLFDRKLVPWEYKGAPDWARR